MSRTVLPLPVRDVSAFAKALSRQLSSLGRTPGHLELLNMLARSAGFQNFQHLREARPTPGSPVESLSGELSAGSAQSDLGEMSDRTDAQSPAQSAQTDAQGRSQAGQTDAHSPVQADREVEQRLDQAGSSNRPSAPHEAGAPGDAGSDQLDQLDQRRLNRLLRYFDQSGRMTRWPGKHGQQTDCLWVVWSRLPSGPAGDEAAMNARLTALHTFGDHALLRRELYDRGFLDRTPDGRAYRRLERKPGPLALALIRRVGRERHG